MRNDILDTNVAIHWLYSIKTCKMDKGLKENKPSAGSCLAPLLLPTQNEPRIEN